MRLCSCVPLSRRFAPPDSRPRVLSSKAIILLRSLKHALQHFESDLIGRYHVRQKSVAVRTGGYQSFLAIMPAAAELRRVAS